MRMSGGVIVDGLWKANAGNNGLFLVGRVLTQRMFNFEGLCASIKSMILPERGMEFKQLPEGRILIRFFHALDNQRPLDGCPRSFGKNVLILNGIGNKLGTFHDMEMNEVGRAWGVSLRIRAVINANNLLKRALKIRTTMVHGPRGGYTIRPVAESASSDEGMTPSLTNRPDKHTSSSAPPGAWSEERGGHFWDFISDGSSSQGSRHRPGMPKATRAKGRRGSARRKGRARTTVEVPGMKDHGITIIPGSDA
ncbi:hypothetical protein Salat_2556300 [Sesamum alatum]|uniref:DUF4283 domain-containing protein n=1 Tax=Sesamum alatum TaxID=300844 RepID=A0AAE1XSU7_9LAMI|nr:hypothetical protein Salat_2556300 [Sesamum alatum]